MIEEAVGQAMQAHQTDDPLIASIFLAENINQRNGGALVKPWEMDEMPEDYRMAYFEIVRVAARWKVDQAYMAASEKYHAAFRRNHPSYRKY